MRYLGKRLISSAVTLLMVTFVVFYLIHLIPGDPIAVMLGEHANPTDVVNLRRSLGLDRPLLGQYELFMGNLFHGCLLYTSPSPRDGLLSRMPSSA